MTPKVPLPSDDRRPVDITPIFDPERMAERQGEVDSDARLSASRGLLEEAACLLAGLPPVEPPSEAPQAPFGEDPAPEASSESPLQACPSDPPEVSPPVVIPPVEEPSEFLWFVWNPGALLPPQACPSDPPGSLSEPLQGHEAVLPDEPLEP